MNERRAEFDALIAEYRRDLPQKLARIESLLSGGRLAELRRAVHTLAGSARTYGLPRVGQAAAAAEAYLEASADALDAAGRAELERLVARLADEVRSATGVR
jgi:HPt (histidine-containing phosphotransfer) domain-containing protein